MKAALPFLAGLVIGGSGVLGIGEVVTGSVLSRPQTASIPPAVGPAPVETLKAAFHNEEKKEFDAAKEAVLQRLLDPSSAQFEALRIAASGDEKHVCGMVNSRNRMGGYVGRKPFAYDTVSSYAWVIDGPEAAYIAGERVLKVCFPTMKVPKTPADVRFAKDYPAIWNSP